MKRHILLFLFFALISSTGLAQNKTVKPARKKIAAKAFTREKFDPTRDANADLAAAIETAGKTNRRIILDVGGEWCSWCVHMDKFIYGNKALAKLRDDNFVWVKVNMSEQNENKPFLSAYPPIEAYPYLLVLETDGKFLHGQDTGDLEYRETYDLKRFTRFLQTWVPEKN